MANQLKCEKVDDTILKITLNGKLYTQLYYNNFELANRPFFYPVLAPCGTMVTRNYPIKKVDGDTQDHIHHTSLWSAWGEIKASSKGSEKVDNWAYGKNKGRQVVKNLSYEENTDNVIILLDIDWTTPDEEKIQLKEKRTIIIYGDGKMDFTIDLKPASESEAIKFLDTKEGGFISVRVATSMDVPNGGIITLSTGAVCDSKESEKFVWGKRAKWCDYSGTVDGKDVGICVFDHPKNDVHPTYWHVRSYGLMGANPYGTRFFKKSLKDQLLKVRYVLKKPKSLVFKYRLIIHDERADLAKLNAQYDEYIK